MEDGKPVVHMNMVMEQSIDSRIYHYIRTWDGGLKRISGGVPLNCNLYTSNLLNRHRGLIIVGHSFTALLLLRT